MNAAIEALIAQTAHAEEAARIVIDYGHHLKKSGPVVWETRRTKSTSGPSLSGHVAGHGEIAVKDRDRMESREFAFGVHKDRIGHYRLWKQSDGLLRMHHFWASDLATQGIDEREVDEYYLGYNRNSLAFSFFAILRERRILSWRIRYRHEIGAEYLERISGTGRLPKLGFYYFVSD